MTWGYAALAAAFLALAAFQLPHEGPRHPSLGFVRVASQPLLGLVPQGLPRLDLDRLRSSVARMAPVRLLRQLGNSLRLAAGQKVEWIVWGGRDPLTLFPSMEIWVCGGLHPALERELAALAGSIAGHRQLLAAEGWTLIVVPVPVKLGIHQALARWPLDAGLVTRLEVPADRSDEVHGFLVEALRARDVATVDLQSIYRAELARRPGLLLYPAGDSHWSGEGLRIAAEATAGEIAKRTTLRARRLANPSLAEVEHVADLASAFDVLPGFTTRLAPAYLLQERITSRESGRPYVVPADPQGLVVAVGSSYTFYYTGHAKDPIAFPWQLGLRLPDAEVRQEAQPGALGAFESFLQRRGQLAGDFEARRGAAAAKVVVWEFPMREALSLKLPPPP